MEAQSFGDKVGYQAKVGAKDKSTGLCLRLVGFAVQRAKGIKEHKLGIESAKDAGTWVISQGYYVSNTSNYVNGTIVVFQSIGTHNHGHIQVYYDGKWYSDFKQKGFWPFADGSKPAYQVYIPN